MNDENRLYWIWLSEKCGIASREFRRLAEHYEDPFELYSMSDSEIEGLEGIGAALKARLCDKTLESAYAILRYCRSHRVTILPYGDAQYPARLRTIEDPPVLLYVLGDLPDLNDRLCIGMVGTRKMSEYGRQSAYTISYELAAANAVVVSGMALGVDGVSACGALAAGGTTVAVLGCGISVVYPKEHEKLMKAIARHGAVITEYPPDERPFGGNFPKRNRIISGLCQGVLVVEGAAGSGALITAQKAISQGRELFALPGKINESNSDGPNELIRHGANVALCAEDILRHYDFLYHDRISYKGLQRAKRERPEEERVLRQYGVAAVYAGGRKKRKVADFMENSGAYAEQAPPKEPFPQQMQVPPSAEPKPKKVTHTASAEALNALDETTRKIFAALPLDRAVSPDAPELSEIGIGEVITALTLLELSGLVESLPGGLYIRK
ncbi:MAG: DNA-protecting protein DprA [Ruminococcaceae bacterium]|nr:DNA-protecting protein DprA [Oscillospiraceae bacterium]